MNGEYDDLDPQDDRDAVVTYTRISGRRRRKRPAGRARAERATGPVLDAAEIDRAAPGEAVAFEFSAGDPPTGRASNVEEFVEDTRRPDWLRYGLVGASLAIFVGAGILAATVGLATMLPGGSGQDEGAGAPVLAVNSEDIASGSDLTTGAIREITMPTGAPEAAWRAEITPPIPRPRPDDVLASVEFEPGSEALLPTPAPQPAGASETQQATPEVAARPSAPAPKTIVERPESAGSDSLITSIEETLARIDATAPTGTGTDPAVLPDPAPAPPPVAAPSPSVLPAAPPPMVMTQPIDPSSDIALPPATAPTYDIAPPPAAVEGYDGYVTGPVPPEPVPEPYPQAAPMYPDGYFYPQSPRLHPADPYTIPPETAEETQDRRPGFLRRTVARATGAVGRVFRRD